MREFRCEHITTKQRRWFFSRRDRLPNPTFPFARDAGSPSSSSPLHVVICPWLAFGHLLPCRDLAERLASRWHRVSFVSTPRNIARLPPVRPDAAPRVDLVPLPLPRVDGLPDGAESTNDVPHELLWKAFDGLAEPFSEFLGAACADEGQRPDWVIVDVFHHWAAAAALQHEVPCVMLLLRAANNIAGWARRSPEPAAATDEQATATQGAAAPPRYESERAKRFHTNHGMSEMSVAQRCFLTLERCTLGAMRSCEPESVPLAATHGGKSVVRLGLMPPSPAGARGTSMNGEDAAERWLDAQPGELGSVRRTGERGAAARGAGARAGARRDTISLGAEEAQRRPRRGHPPSGLPRAHPRPWARDDGVGSSAQHRGARCRGRILDTLLVELDHRGASVRAPSESCYRSTGTKGRMRG